MPVERYVHGLVCRDNYDESGVLTNVHEIAASLLEVGGSWKKRKVRPKRKGLSSKNIFADVLTCLSRAGWVNKHQEYDFETFLSCEQRVHRILLPHAECVARDIADMVNR